MRASLLFAACIACSEGSPRLPTAGLFSSAPGSQLDSGDGATTGSTDGDSAPVETPDPAEEVVCANPERRSTVGPFEPMPLPEIPLQESGPDIDLTNASGLAVGDLDGDGRLDILLPQVGRPLMLLQQPDGSFVDEAEARWPGATDAAPGQAAVHTVDIDGDRDLDVFLCSGPAMGAEGVALYNQLFLNDGSGHLTNVSEAWGLEALDLRACFGAAFGDIDGDGDLDMAQAVNQACIRDPMTGEEDCDALFEQTTSQVLWENTGSSFIDISDRLPLDRMLGSFAHVVTLIDVDGDQDLDLYITNDKKVQLDFSEGNLLFWNDGSGQFTLDDGSSGLHIDLSGMGLAVTDDNDDGLPDFLLSSTQRLAFLVSDPSFGWFDAASARGLTFSAEGHIEPWSIDFADTDHDGDLDIPVTFGYMSGSMSDETNFRQPDAFFDNRGDDTWVEIAAELGLDDRGIGRGLVVVDIDGDGWVDILKRELGGTLVGWRAVCGDAPWMQVELSQPGPNPHAVGAVVLARFGDQTQRRWVLGGGTTFASNAVAPLHFGLGAAEVVEQLEVTWPDGAITVWGDLPARRIHRLSRPEE